MILVVAFVIASIAVGATFIGMTARMNIQPRELRGDWWSRFESDFWEYTARSASAGRSRRRRHDTPPY
jgi:hypothetical protein